MGMQSHGRTYMAQANSPAQIYNAEPVVVHSVTLTAIGATATVLLYDDSGATTSPQVYLSAVADTTVHAEYPEGLLFETGIYSVMTGANSAMTMTTSAKGYLKNA